MVRYVAKLQERGPAAGGLNVELDPIRSEYPTNAGSGFIAQASLASMNLVLSIPSGKVFLWKYLYIVAGTVGTVMFYDGGSVAGGSTTIFQAYVPSIQSSPNGNEYRPMGVYVYSLLWASMGAASTPGMKVGGYLLAVSTVE